MPRLYFFRNNCKRLRGEQSAISPGPPQLTKDTTGLLPFCLQLLAGRMHWRMVESEWNSLACSSDLGMQWWARPTWAIFGGASCLPGVSSWLAHLWTDHPGRSGWCPHVLACPRRPSAGSLEGTEDTQAQSVSMCSVEHVCPFFWGGYPYLPSDLDSHSRGGYEPGPPSILP